MAQNLGARQGLHPLERYLNHLRGHKASRVAHSRATSLIAFEGPMTAKKAAAREVSLAEKLGAAGMQTFDEATANGNCFSSKEASGRMLTTLPRGHI